MSSTRISQERKERIEFDQESWKEVQEIIEEINDYWMK